MDDIKKIASALESDSLELLNRLIENLDFEMGENAYETKEGKNNFLKNQGAEKAKPALKEQSANGVHKSSQGQLKQPIGDKQGSEVVIDQDYGGKFKNLLNASQQNLSQPEKSQKILQILDDVEHSKEFIFLKGKELPLIMGKSEQKETRKIDEVDLSKCQDGDEENDGQESDQEEGQDETGEHQDELSEEQTELLDEIQRVQLRSTLIVI